MGKVPDEAQVERARAGERLLLPLASGQQVILTADAKAVYLTLADKDYTLPIRVTPREGAATGGSP